MASTASNRDIFTFTFYFTVRATVFSIIFPLLLQVAGGHQWNAACDATSCTFLVISTTSECTDFEP
jgi:hypothetical protein